MPRSEPVLPVDSRRQTGAGRLLDDLGAALEVHLPEAEHAEAERLWRMHALELAEAVGWSDTQLVARPFPGGLSLALTSPVDALYGATEINEAAWAAADAERLGRPLPDREDALARIRREIGDEHDSRLVALLEAASSRGVPAIWDDETITLGYGARGQSWAPEALPEPGAVNWDSLGAIPLALVTGTNGKSTTVRILAGMAEAAGETAGVSTTDYIAVGDEILDTGDYSGPMGARATLADTRVTMGVLEVARGGLLRRGLPVPVATTVAVTNVAADHLGEYGVMDVVALAETKFLVAKALQAGGTLVCPADEPTATAEARRLAPDLIARGVRMVWTALDPADADRQLEDQPSVCGAATVRDGVIVHQRAGEWVSICPVADIPGSWDGTAEHVVRNALTASALGHALGLDDDALATGLRAFKGDPDDNPGRANRFTVDGATVVVDYAHNAHGLRALIQMAKHWPARRRLILASTAGDRSNADLAAMADVLTTFEADRYLLCDAPGYLRGRPSGEIPRILEAELVSRGIPPESCTCFPGPLESAHEALAWARDGDVVLLPTMQQRDAVTAFVKSQAAEGE
ncbi:MAG: Mur ligase family protein [Bacteroidota bacterium]